MHLVFYPLFPSLFLLQGKKIFYPFEMNANSILSIILCLFSNGKPDEYDYTA